MCRWGAGRKGGDVISDVRQASEQLNQIRGAEFVKAAKQGSLPASLSPSQPRWWVLALSPRLCNTHRKLPRPKHDALTSAATICNYGALTGPPTFLPPLPLPVILCLYRCGILGINTVILFFLFYSLRCAKSSQIKTVCSSNIFFKGSRFRYRWGRMCACLVLDSVCLQHVLNNYRECDSTWPPLFTHSASCQSYYQV